MLRWKLNGDEHLLVHDKFYLIISAPNRLIIVFISLRVGEGSEWMDRWMDVFRYIFCNSVDDWITYRTFYQTLVVLLLAVACWHYPCCTNNISISVFCSARCTCLYHPQYSLCRCSCGERLHEEAETVLVQSTANGVFSSHGELQFWFLEEKKCRYVNGYFQRRLEPRTVSLVDVRGAY